MTDRRRSANQIYSKGPATKSQWIRPGLHPKEPIKRTSKNTHQYNVSVPENTQIQHKTKNYNTQPQNNKAMWPVLRPAAYSTPYLNQRQVIEQSQTWTCTYDTDIKFYLKTNSEHTSWNTPKLVHIHQNLLPCVPWTRPTMHPLWPGQTLPKTVWSSSASTLTLKDVGQLSTQHAQHEEKKGCDHRGPTRTKPDNTAGGTDTVPAPVMRTTCTQWHQKQSTIQRRQGTTTCNLLTKHTVSTKQVKPYLLTLTHELTPTMHIANTEATINCAYLQCQRHTPYNQGATEYCAYLQYP